MKNSEENDSYIIHGKLALPYTYFAGRTGSTFLTTIRDQRRIMGVKCNTCNRVFVPPRQTCERCMADIRSQWVTVASHGEVVNHTVIRYPDKHLPRKPPFVLAMILLKGADTPMVHILEGVNPDRVQKGMNVTAVFSPAATNTLLDIDHFEPVADMP